jgi:hypothetical protein
VEQLLGEVEVIKTLQQKHQEHANPSRRKRA